MTNKEFLAQFARHLIRNAANLKFEQKIEMPTAMMPSPALERISQLEAEKRQAEEMMKTRILQPMPPKQPIDISRIGDKEFAIPVPKISPEEVSLRKELEKAREQVLKSITAPVKPVIQVKPMPTAVSAVSQAVPQIQPEIPSLDLGKLNIFIKNPEITSIECNGPDSVIVIKKGNVPINTTTTLSKDEINDIIHKFSVSTKTEITPIYKAVYEDKMITAFISPLIGTRFVITKAK